MFRKSLVCLLLVCVISANAQGIGFFGFGGGFGFPVASSEFYNIALQSAAAKLSAENLPEDLQNRIDDVLANAELAFLNCQGSVFWQYRRCTALELKNAMNGLNAIESEFNARNATTTTAPASEASADSGAVVA